MVLRPIGGAEAISPPGCVPVWDAILPTQKTCAPGYWLIPQVDHAALSGAIAAALGPPLLSRLSPEVVEGITHHDDGWVALDAQITPINGQPLSFLDFLPKDFLRVWNGSIERAERIAPIAGAIVSRHFCRLGRNRLDWAIDSAEDRELLAGFLANEQARQQRLPGGGRSRAELEFLTDVLQFCDVLSLYLCCGAIQDVELQQSFGMKPIRLRREAARSPEQAAVCRFEPTPFAEGGVDLAVVARRYPPGPQPGTVTLPFLLW